MLGPKSAGWSHMQPGKSFDVNRPDVLFGGIEAGGTKFVCAAGTGPDDIQPVSFATTTPDVTIKQAIDYFRSEQDRRGLPLVAVGIGSFGPVDLNPASLTYGYITSTPKPSWADTDLAGTISRALGVPVGFDTDVNAAALGEFRWGAAHGLDTFIYLTVGTGIGGGGLTNGALMHGLIHPEMGHIRLPRDKEIDTFEGICPFHGDCLEGLASGKAVGARWGRPAQELPADHPAWALEAHYLAIALADFICTLSPRRIIMGGGIMQREHLFPMVRSEVRQLLNGYIQAPEILDDDGLAGYIVPPGLGGRSGVLGSIALGQQIAAQPLS